MNKFLKYLLPLFILVLFSECHKAPINREIEGMWQLKTITTLEDNKTRSCERLYYSITRMVTEVAEKQGPNKYGAYICRSEYRENETILVLKDFKVQINTNDTGENATSEQLKPFGIINPKETVFFIKSLNHHHMTLESDYARLELKKF